MPSRLGEKGAVQHATQNTGSAATTSALAGAGWWQRMYLAYVSWKAANAGVTPSRLGARGKLYAAMKDAGL